MDCMWQCLQASNTASRRTEDEDRISTSSLSRQSTRASMNNFAVETTAKPGSQPCTGEFSWGMSSIDEGIAEQDHDCYDIANDWNDSLSRLVCNDNPDVLSIPEVIAAAREDTRGSSNKKNRFCCRFIFTISSVQAAAFQLVPKLLGHCGKRVSAIASATRSKIRIRGQGSGHLEGHGNKEAQVPLQMALSSSTAEDFMKARKGVEVLLQRTAERYFAYCQIYDKKPPSKFYIILEGGR